MSNEAPEDEMFLAELIAAASAHGLRSCRGALFQDCYGNAITSHDHDHDPPERAVSCCALGACKLIGLAPSIPGFRLGDGNDAGSYEVMPSYLDEATEICMWNIGAAFEIAMRDKT